MLDYLFAASDLELLSASARLTEEKIDYQGYTIPKSVQKTDLKTQIVLIALYKVVINLLENQFKNHTQDKDYAILYTSWMFNDGQFDEVSVHLITDQGALPKNRSIKYAYDREGFNWRVTTVDLCCNTIEELYTHDILQVTSVDRYDDARVSPFAVVDLKNKSIKLKDKGRLIKRKSEDLIGSALRYREELTDRSGNAVSITSQLMGLLDYVVFAS